MLRELFNVPVYRRAPAPADLRPRDTPLPSSAPASAPDVGAPGEVQREGAFVTTQSLASFAGATAAVAVISGVLGRLVPSWSGSPAMIGVVSLIIGLTIFLISETDPQGAPKSPRERVVSLIIALINTCVIFSAAIGTNSLGAAPGSPPTQNAPVEVNHG